MLQLTDLDKAGIQYSSTKYTNGADVIMIAIFEHPFEEKLIGIVESTLLSTWIPIGYMPTTNEINFGELAWSKENSQASIRLNQEYAMDLRERTDEIVFILFHELGHFFNGDAEKHLNLKQAETERIEKVKRHDILETEYMADDFAVSFLGDKKVVAGLIKLKNRLVKFSDFENADIAIREIDYRISRLLKT